MTSPEQVIAALDSIHALVAAGWCQGHYAIDSSGLECDSRSPRAVRFCLDGAAQCVTRLGPTSWPLYGEVGRALRDTLWAKQPEWSGYVTWNDAPERTKGEVLALVVATKNRMAARQRAV